MLKLAWYLITDRDYWKDNVHLGTVPQAGQLTDQLAALFSDDGPYTPEHTATATDIMLRMAEHVGDAVRHGPATVPDRAHLDRLLHALNLLLAHRAQAGGRLAHQADTGTGADLSGLSPASRQEIVRGLAAATGRLEEAAGLLKEAHLAARSWQEPRR